MNQKKLIFTLFLFSSNSFAESLPIKQVGALTSYKFTAEKYTELSCSVKGCLFLLPVGERALEIQSENQIGKWTVKTAYGSNGGKYVSIKPHDMGTISLNIESKRRKYLLKLTASNTLLPSLFTFNLEGTNQAKSPGEEKPVLKNKVSKPAPEPKDLFEGFILKGCDTCDIYPVEIKVNSSSSFIQLSKPISAFKNISLLLNGNSLSDVMTYSVNVDKFIINSPFSEAFLISETDVIKIIKLEK